MKLTGIALIGGTVLSVVFMSGQIWETVEKGTYHVKQAFYTGDMSVIADSGTYYQMFGKVTQYPVSDVYDFSGVKNRAEETIPVRFNDASTADISGQIKFRLSSKMESAMHLHEDFRGYTAVKQDLIRQIVADSLKASATHFKAEDVYSTRRAEFIELVNDQIKDGIYSTKVNEYIRKDAQGNEFVERRVQLILDEDGKPAISKQNALKDYSVTVVNFVIKEIDFDDKTDGLIAKRKESEQKAVVAKAAAEESKQNAITAEEKGKANVAKAKYEALVDKERKVIEAEKQTAIQVEKTKQATESAKQNEVKGRAEALKQKLLVEAGLSPLQQAEIDRDKEIGVMEKWSNRPVPKIMIINGTGGGGTSGMNPLDVLAYDKLQQMVNSPEFSK